MVFMSSLLSLIQSLASSLASTLASLILLRIWTKPPSLLLLPLPRMLGLPPLAVAVLPSSPVDDAAGFTSEGSTLSPAPACGGDEPGRLLLVVALPLLPLLLLLLRHVPGDDVSRGVLPFLPAEAAAGPETNDVVRKLAACSNSTPPPTPPPLPPDCCCHPLLLVVHGEQMRPLPLLASLPRPPPLRTGIALAGFRFRPPEAALLLLKPLDPTLRRTPPLALLVAGTECSRRCIVMVVVVNPRAPLPPAAAAAAEKALLSVVLLEEHAAAAALRAVHGTAGLEIEALVLDS